MMDEKQSQERGQYETETQDYKNNHQQTQQKLEGQSSVYQEYSYRWFIVILMGGAFLVNGLANNAVIPIAHKLSTTYDLSDTYVDSPVLVSFLVYSLMNFPANHLIDTKGLRLSLLIGTCLYAVGLGLFSMINSGYHWVLLGAILVALGQPFVINCPAKVATFWFSAQNRPFATALMTGLNIIATGVGVVLPTAFVKEDSTGDQAKQQVGRLYFRYFLVAMILFAFHFFFMKAHPPTPPSKGAAQQKTSVLQSFRNIKQSPNLMKFFGAYTILYGTLLSFGAISNQLFKPYGYEDLQIAMLGICLIVFGVIGSIVFSLYLKKTKNYGNAVRKITRYSLALMVANTLWLNLVGTLGGTIILAIFLGFMFTPLVPVSYDLGCQLAFPIGQAQVIGIMNGGAMMLTFFLTLILSSAIGFQSREHSKNIMTVYIILLATGTFIYGKVQIILKRTQFQERSQQETQKKDNLEKAQQMKNNEQKQFQMNFDIEQKDNTNEKREYEDLNQQK